MALEYIIYSDESSKKGAFFSHFYGGALVRSTDLEYVKSVLQSTKQNENLHGEIKWSKVTSQYLEKYQTVMQEFFALIASEKVKIRIMFTQNAYVVRGLSAEQRENEFFLLYYQFIKHAFGLTYSNSSSDPIGLRIYLDNLPDTAEKRARFKGYLVGLNKSRGFSNSQIFIQEDQIAEVDSRDHVILQCLDIVLGSMYFRLNNLHKIKPEGQRTRGKRTIAKEKLYRYINQQIRAIYPGFNVGISTSVRGKPENNWCDSYRHWLFTPQSYHFDRSLLKRPK